MTPCSNDMDQNTGYIESKPPPPLSVPDISLEVLAFLALSSWFLLGAEPEGAKSSVGKEVEVGSGQRFLMVSQVAVNLSPLTISLLGSPWD